MELRSISALLGKAGRVREIPYFVGLWNGA